MKGGDAVDLEHATRAATSGCRIHYSRALQTPRQIWISDACRAEHASLVALVEGIVAAETARNRWRILPALGDVIKLAGKRKNHTYEPVVWGTAHEDGNPPRAWLAVKLVGTPTWFFGTMYRIVREQSRLNVCAA